jgi:hypothetical protein
MKWPSSQHRRRNTGYDQTDAGGIAWTRAVTTTPSDTADRLAGENDGLLSPGQAAGEPANPSAAVSPLA